MAKFSTFVLKCRIKRVFFKEDFLGFMAENVELKLEQLTDAIRSLYSKPVLSNSEISNMMTSLAQKFENTTDVNSQKFTGIVINETRKILEEKQYEIRQQLTGFENALKQMSQTISNPKMSMEISKILSEVTDMYSKLGNQEVALQKINQTLVSSKSTSPFNEIIKLSNEFAAFSRGFENITHTLNKNFADFLTEVKAYNSQEELKNLSTELDTINGNVNSVISALAIIDHKYRDLTGLVEAFRSKETTFEQNISNIKQIGEKFDTINDKVANASSKEDLRELKEQINQLNDNFRLLNNSTDESINKNSEKFTNALNAVENKLSQTSSLQDINNLKGEIKTHFDKLSLQNSTNKDELIGKIQENISKLRAQSDDGLKNQIFEHTNGLNQGINFISSQMSKVENNIEASLSQKTQKMNEDVSALKDKLDRLEQNLGKVSENTVLDEIKTIEDNIRTITKDSLSSVATLITSEFSNLDKALGDKNIENNENLNYVLNSLKEDLRNYTQKIETLKEEIAEINQGSIKLFREPIEKTLKELNEITIKENFENVNQNIKGTAQGIFETFKEMRENLEKVLLGTNIEILSQLKDTIPAIAERFEVLRDQLVNVNSENIQYLKESFKESSQSIKEYIEDINLKIKEEIINSYGTSLNEIKIDLQNFSNNLIESVENININISREFKTHKENLEEFLIDFKSASLQNTEPAINLNSLKGDIIEGILGVNKNNKANFAIIEEKINKVLAAQIKTESENSNDVVLEIINNVLEKIEHANQQQIHNAKELLEEIQTNGTQILKKIEEQTQDEPLKAVFDDEINSKLENLEQKISQLNTDKEEELKESIETFKERLERLSSETIEQLSDKINEISGAKDEFSVEENPQLSGYLSKIDEYLANVEYLKNNLSEDLRECIETQVMDLQDKFETVINTKNDETKVETSNLIQKVSNVENNIEKINSNVARMITSADDTNYAYSLQDVESDIAKLRLSIEKNLKGDNYKEFISRLIELKNINIENNKLNHNIEGQMTHLGGWLKATSQRLETLSQKVENAERMSMEEIKTRLIRSEKSHDGAKIEEVSKKQISYLEDLDEKLNLIMQKQNNGFDPTSFIDVTYENMQQTKELSSRMDELEVKIDKIQGYMEKIIAYIEE